MFLSTLESRYSCLIAATRTVTNIGVCFQYTTSIARKLQNVDCRNTK